MTTNINLPFITADANGPKHLDVMLTRAKFEELTHDLVERTIGPMQTALRDADLTSNDIDKVILVGGSTRIPAVQNAVKNIAANLSRVSTLMSALRLAPLYKRAFLAEM